MDIQFYGANCLVLTTQGTRVVVDDNLSDLDGKTVTKSGDVVLFTGTHPGFHQGLKLGIDLPGEYEIADVSVYGIPARAHIDEDKQRTAVMYKLIAKDVRVLVTGHIYPKLTERDLEAIGTVDVLIVPVGGNGFTLDAVGVTELIKEIEPKLVIPTYYHDAKLKFPVPAHALDQALQSLGLEVKERISKLRLKAGDFSDTTQLIVLENS